MPCQVMSGSFKAPICVSTAKSFPSNVHSGNMFHVIIMAPGILGMVSINVWISHALMEEPGYRAPDF